MGGGRRSGHGGGTADGPPGGEAFVAGLAVAGGAEAVAARAAVAGDGAVGGEEALGVARMLEAAHPPLPLARGLVRMLRPVVEPLVLPMLDAREHLTQRRAVARELVGDHHAWGVRQALEQLPEEPHGRALIASRLDQDVEHGAVLVDGPPEVVLHPVDRDDDLVKMACLQRTYSG